MADPPSPAGPMSRVLEGLTEGPQAAVFIWVGVCG